MRPSARGPKLCTLLSRAAQRDSSAHGVLVKCQATAPTRARSLDYPIFLSNIANSFD